MILIRNMAMTIDRTISRLILNRTDSRPQTQQPPAADSTDRKVSPENNIPLFIAIAVW